MTFEIPYPPTKRGKAAWNRRFGLNAYYAGKPWPARRRDAEELHTIALAAMRRVLLDGDRPGDGASAVRAGPRLDSLPGAAGPGAEAGAGGGGDLAHHGLPAVRGDPAPEKQPGGSPGRANFEDLRTDDHRGPWIKARRLLTGRDL